MSIFRKIYRPKKAIENFAVNLKSTFNSNFPEKIVYQYSSLARVISL